MIQLPVLGACGVPYTFPGRLRHPSPILTTMRHGRPMLGGSERQLEIPRGSQEGSKIAETLCPSLYVGQTRDHVHGPQQKLERESSPPPPPPQKKKSPKSSAESLPNPSDPPKSPKSSAARDLASHGDAEAPRPGDYEEHRNYLRNSNSNSNDNNNKQ